MKFFLALALFLWCFSNSFAAVSTVDIKDPEIAAEKFLCTGRWEQKLYRVLFSYDGWQLGGLSKKSFSGYAFSLDEHGNMAVSKGKYFNRGEIIGWLKCSVTSKTLVQQAKEIQGAKNQERLEKESEQNREAVAAAKKAQEARERTLKQRVYDNCIIDKMPVGATGSLAMSIKRECEAISNSPSVIDKLRYQ